MKNLISGRHVLGLLIVIPLIVGMFSSTRELDAASSLWGRLKGRILLDVQNNGEAWYVDPRQEQRVYLGRPEDAFAVMRSFGVGITNRDLNKIPSADGYSDGHADRTFAKKQAGKIFLQVENSGEAWYVHPVELKRYYLGRPSQAFEIMRKTGLGISSYDIAAIPAAVRQYEAEIVETYQIQEARIEHNEQPSPQEIVETHPLQINGDTVCVYDTNRALSLLKAYAPLYYSRVLAVVGVVACQDADMIYPWENPPRYGVKPTISSAGPQWYASDIVGQACFMQRHRDFVAKNPDKAVPTDIYTRDGTDRACLSEQYDALGAVGASESALTHLRAFIDARNADALAVAVDIPKTDEVIESHPLRIIGDDFCSSFMNKALTLLKRKAPDHYVEVIRRIGIIECIDGGSGVYTQERPARYVVNKKALSSTSILWKAGVLPHEACHVRLYQEYEAAHPGSAVPPTIDGGDEAEGTCLKPMIDALTQLGADQQTLDYVKNDAMKKKWWEVSYDKRDW